MTQQHKRVAVKLAGEPGVRYSREPLTFGVPFADNTFPRGTPLRAVTADGRSLPIQTACTTTWDKDLRHVKWLLVDLQADPAADGETVWLEMAERSDKSDASDGATPLTIATAHADGILTIDTGVLRLRLRTDFPHWEQRTCDSPFAGCEVKTADGWREVLHGPGLLLYMKDQHGNLYTSLCASPPPRVIVEEQGPLRVCVLITGHLFSAQGVRFCPYRLRIHLYAGKADLRIFHTFVFDQDPTRVELAAIGLKVFVRTGDKAVAAMGGEDTTLSETLSKPETDKARDKEGERVLSLLQTDDLHYTTALDGSPLETGARASGWASLGGDRAGVAAAVRDFWQEYPKGFRVERDMLDVRIWPEDAPGPLSFLTPFRKPAIYFNGTRDEAKVRHLLAERPAAPLNLKSFGIAGIEDVRWVEDVVARLAPGRVMSYNNTGTDNGIGAAKTTEFLLRFADAPVADTEADALAASVQEPLVAIVNPDYLCGTSVFGHFLPAGDSRFASVDQYLDTYFPQIMIDPIERCRLYGMMRYGNMICLHSPAPPWVYHFYKDTEPEKALRYIGPFHNESFDQVMAVWGQFLRCGDRRDRRIAELASRATADVGFIHAYPDDEDRVGCIHYHNAHAWSGTPCWSHAIVDGIMTDYYITGNRRLLDVALEAADGVVNLLTPAGIVNAFSRLVREFTGPLTILMQAYQATWAERYGTPAARSLAWLLRTVRTPGWLPYSVYTRGPRGDEAIVEPEFPPSVTTANLYQLYADAWRLFPSQTLHDFLLAAADHWVWRYPRKAAIAHDGVVVCLAYEMTGRPEYAAHALEVVSAFPREGLSGQNEEALYTLLNRTLWTDGATEGKAGGEPVLNPYTIDYYSWIPRLMRTVVQAMDADPEGFAEHARAWRAQRQELPDFQWDRPEDMKALSSLGVLATDPTGT